MELIGNTFSFPWEVELMSWLQNSLPESVISALSRLSFFGEEIFLVAVLGFIYWSYDKQAGRRLGISLLMINVWAPMIKNVALRRRPYMDHEQITLKRLVEKGADPMDISAQGYTSTVYNVVVPVISEASSRKEIDSTYFLKLKDFILFKEGIENPME